MASPKRSLAMVVYDYAATQRCTGKRERQEEEEVAAYASSPSSSSMAAKRARQEDAASASASGACAGAIIIIPRTPPAVLDVKPINAVPPRQPLPAAREVPPCLREHFLPALGFRPDLPVHFIGEKAVTKTDVDPHQNRFRIPLDGVECCLRAILTPAELDAANLLRDMGPRPKNHKPKKKEKPADDGEAVEETELQQGKKVEKTKKKKGKVHGGLRVKLVDLAAGVSMELQMSRWDSTRSTVVKGVGYLDFIRRCSFGERDAVEIWGFMQRPVRIFGVDVQHGDGVLHVLVAKKHPPPQRCCYCSDRHA